MKKFILVFISVVLFFFLLAFVFYKSNAAPDFTNLVNELFNISSKKDTESQIDNQTENIEQNEIEVSNSILNRIPLLLSYEANDAKDEKNDLTGDEFETFAVTVNHYSLSLNQPAWTYENTYPIISEPAVFSDTVIFIDAEPALVCLNKETGLLQHRLPCSVFPKGPAYSLGLTYVFQANAGGWFQIQFQEGSDQWPTALELQEQELSKKDFSEMLPALVYPNLEAQSKITTSMNDYVASLDPLPLPDVLLYDTSSQVVEFQHTHFSPLYIFSPEEQGSYTFGLCDSQGSWIRGNAFTVLFSKNGEVEAISLDYVADRPQISIHLSDTQLYYVCCGFMGLEETSTGYFQVKKAP